MAQVEIEKGAFRKKGISYVAGWALLNLMGWEFDPGQKPEGKKFVLVAAPHTSNWDLPLMLACSYLSGYRLSWLGKHTLFRGVGKPFFRWLGGVPVDRTAPQGLVQQVVDIFSERDSLILAIPPEGTRAKTDGWKTGFYYIALGAEVPIVLSYLDYGNKRAGFGPVIEPSGDIEADFELFRQFYADKRGLYPEWQGEVKVREKRRYVKPPRKGGSLQLIVDAYNSMRPRKA